MEQVAGMKGGSQYKIVQKQRCSIATQNKVAARFIHSLARSYCRLRDTTTFRDTVI